MNTAKFEFILSMVIVGSVGLFVRLLPFASSQVAMARGAIGCIFVLSFSLLFKKKISLKRIKDDFIILICSGTALGINWILLFQSFHYTTIANATICYYIAPVIVVLLSPVLLKEKLTLSKVCCVFGAITGIALIAGIGGRGSNDFIGVLYGLGAAVFYASMMLLNKFLHQVTGIERTIIQLAAATISLLPYVAFTTTVSSSMFSAKNVMLLLVVGIVHTGCVYLLYFSSMKNLKGQTIALLSYIDPVVAILLSSLLLKEPMTMWQMVGGALILGSAIISETYAK